MYKDQRKLSGTYSFLEGAFPENQIPKYTVNIPLVVFTGISVVQGLEKILIPWVGSECFILSRNLSLIFLILSMDEVHVQRIFQEQRPNGDPRHIEY